jgi:acyl-CoA synthetase (AMP-forming)/AMP-acid ligase II
VDSVHSSRFSPVTSISQPTPEALIALAAPHLLPATAVGMATAVWARLLPDYPAVISASGSRTYAKLNAHANQLVRALRARGVKGGDGVALMCSNRAEFAEVLAEGFHRR